MKLPKVTWLLLLATSIIAIAAAVPAVDNKPEPAFLNATDSSYLEVRGYDPSPDYHGWKQIEVWNGRMPVMLGDSNGIRLYDQIMILLEKACPNTPQGSCSTWTQPWENYLLPQIFWTGKAGTIVEKGEWSTLEDRNLLFRLVAGIYRTETEDLRNCIQAPGIGKKYCNVGDIVRVNVGKTDCTLGTKTFLHIRMKSTTQDWKNAGRFFCCQGRERVDMYLDTFADELGRWGQRGYSREVRCIIDGFKVCTKDMD